MTAGDLLGGGAVPPRRPGRPKGSRNKRAADLKGFIAAKYGAGAAQQMAAVCMVTPAEVKAAGSMIAARVAKAQQLVDLVREADAGRDSRLRQVVREELEHLAAEMGEAKAKELRRLVAGFLHRVREASAAFGVREALKMMDDQQAALLPYTDQRQPQAVDLKTNAPHVVVLGGQADTASAAMPGLPDADAEIIGEFRDVTPQVSHAKSHDGPEPLVLPGLEPDEPSA